jgi:hypothetical protein
VLVSAYLSPNGRPAQVLEWVYEGRCQLLASEQILAEYRRAMRSEKVRKLTGMTDDEVSAVIARLSQAITLVYPEAQVDIDLKDQADRKFLDCAVSGGADYLVSGDKHHVLPLARIGQTLIVSPTEFLHLAEAGLL